jgi:nitroreductase
MELREAITTRRTHKAFAPEPVPDAVLDELFELARWAPNHNLTNPWRFRVLGPRSLAALKLAAGPESASKLDRAPTLVAVTARQTESDPVQSEEDLLATATATYIVLLAAHDRGLVAYWRTPEVLRRPDGQNALGIPNDEHFVGLLYLGYGRQVKEPPKRAPITDVVTRLP